MGRTTVGTLLGRVLRAGGVDAVYGRPLAGVAVVDVPDLRAAALLAAAHHRVHGRPAAVHGGDGDVVVGTGAAAAHVVSTAEDLLAGVPLVAAGEARLRLGLDPVAPAPDLVPPRPPAPGRWVEPHDAVVAAVSAAARPVVLAGPGVVAAGAVPGLHAVAAAAGVGVLNTWGAKGVFDWRSRHHLATAGLQADDFALAGFGAADLIVATGVDPDEAPADRWRLAPVVDVPPAALDPLAARWARPLADIPMPPLRTGLARVTQEGWSAAGPPLAPSLVTRHYAQAIGAGGLVAADPGVAGYWVARTFATTELGGVHVPGSARAAGTAAASAVVARLRSPGRAVLAAVDGRDRGVDDATGAVLEAARRLGVAVPLAVWDPAGAPLGADDHLAQLEEALVSDAPAPVVLATDPAQLARMVDVAGDVVAWGGLG
jgi:thiamine pyrophosphate-dependent enzyme